MVCVTFWCTLDRDIHKYLFKVTFCNISTWHFHEYSGLFSPSSYFCQVPVSLREDTTVSRLFDTKHVLSGFRCTNFSCTVSHFCASERKLQIDFYTFARRGARRRYMTSWHFIYNFICSFHTSLYVKCHILTRWWRHMTICGSGIWSVIWSVAHESKQGWEGGCDRAGEHEGSSFAATDREGL